MYARCFANTVFTDIVCAEICDVRDMICSGRIAVALLYDASCSVLRYARGVVICCVMLMIDLYYVLCVVVDAGAPL